MHCLHLPLLCSDNTTRHDTTRGTPRQGGVAPHSTAHSAPQYIAVHRSTPQHITAHRSTSEHVAVHHSTSRYTTVQHSNNNNIRNKQHSPRRYCTSKCSAPAHPSTSTTLLPKQTLTIMDTQPLQDADIISDSQERRSDETRPQSFDATWTAIDSAHLIPHLPLKRIPRAWERAPQSPVAKQRFGPKIWRRHDFPQPPRVTAGPSRLAPTQKTCTLRTKTALIAVASPRKIVKKRCLHTSFGQNASAYHWDQKASTPLRMCPFSRSRHPDITSADVPFLSLAKSRYHLC